MYSDDEDTYFGATTRAEVSVEQIINEGYELKAKAQELKANWLKNRKTLEKSESDTQRSEYREVFAAAIDKFNTATEHRAFLWEADTRFPEDYVQKAYYGIAFCQFKLADEYARDNNEVASQNFFTQAKNNLKSISEKSSEHYTFLAECYEKLGNKDKAFSNILHAVNQFNENKQYLYNRSAEKCKHLKERIDQLSQRHNVGVLTQSIEPEAKKELKSEKIERSAGWSPVVLKKPALHPRKEVRSQSPTNEILLSNKFAALMDEPPVIPTPKTVSKASSSAPQTVESASTPPVPQTHIPTLRAAPRPVMMSGGPSKDRTRERNIAPVRTQSATFGDYFDAAIQKGAQSKRKKR